MKKPKEYALWFVDVSDLPGYAHAAKCQQIRDWLDAEKPFGSRYDVVIVPSKENKLCFFKTESEFLEDFHGDSLEWLSNIQDKLENCLTVHLAVQKTDDK